MSAQCLLVVVSALTTVCDVAIQSRLVTYRGNDLRGALISLASLAENSVITVLTLQVCDRK